MATSRRAGRSVNSEKSDFSPAIYAHSRSTVCAASQHPKILNSFFRRPMENIIPIGNHVDSDLRTSKKIFWITFFLTLAVKLVWAITLPLTGEEVYYYQWGRHLHAFYYEHPPLVGWILAAVLLLGKSALFLRIPAILICTLLPLIWLRALPDPDGRVRLGLSIYMLSPACWINVLTTTDTPLILFSGISVACLVIALRERRYSYSVIAGLCLGLALLSKLFAVLLVFAYGVFFLSSKRHWRHAGLMALACLPFAAYLILANYFSCWNNFMFAVVNRSDEAADWRHIPGYLLMAAYLLLPWLIWNFWKERTALRQQWNLAHGRLIVITAILPLLIFLLLSAVVEIGIHWIFSYYLLWFALAGLVLSRHALARALRWTCWLSALHIGAIGALLMAPLSFYDKIGFIKHPVFDLRTKDVYNAIRPANGRHLFGESYKSASFFSYFSDQLVPNFWPGSRHGRHDDVLVDFRQYDGKSIRVFDDEKPDPARYAPFFERISVRNVDVLGTRFWIVDGDGFKYATFRDRTLSTIRRSYYQFPNWLPLGACQFMTRYGFTHSSERELHDREHVEKDGR